MKAKKLLAIVGCALGAAILGGCIYLNSLMPIITGYAAKNLASAVFISGRNQGDVEALDLNFSFIKMNKNKVDYEHKTVTSRFLWAKSTAAYREGYGVTLLRGKDKNAFLDKKYPLPKDTAYVDYLETGDEETVARLEPIAKALVDDRAYNGHPFAFVVLHGGKVVAERYDKGITAETQLLSWSMGKSFTNALVGIMAGDGLVDIHCLISRESHAKLRDFIDETFSMGPDAAELKMARLYQAANDRARVNDAVDIFLSGDVEDSEKLKFPSDEAFLMYMRERLFAPLSISNPHFEPDMSGTPVGSSYLYVTARDYARFGQLFLSDGCIGETRILPEGWVDYTVTPAAASEGKYGAFFWLNRSLSCPDAPEDMFSCQGHDGQEIYIIPSKELVVVILGYSPKPDRVVDFNKVLKNIILRIS